jgi:hypothetical protein
VANNDDFRSAGSPVCRHMILSKYSMSVIPSSTGGLCFYLGEPVTEMASTLQALAERLDWLVPRKIINPIWLLRLTHDLS